MWANACHHNETSLWKTWVDVCEFFENNQECNCGWTPFTDNWQQDNEGTGNWQQDNKARMHTYLNARQAFARRMSLAIGPRWVWKLSCLVTRCLVSKGNALWGPHQDFRIPCVVRTKGFCVRSPNLAWECKGQDQDSWFTSHFVGQSCAVWGQLVGWFESAGPPGPLP